MIELQMTSNALGLLVKLSSFKEILEPEMLAAESKSLDALQNYAVDYMYANFKAPTGELEGAFFQVIEMGASSIEGELVNPLAYAFRRNYGFSGMTDSLGRTFKNDPGIEYMEHTLNAQAPTIEQYFSDAVNNTITAMGG